MPKLLDRSRGLKACRVCGKRLPNTTEYFHKNVQAKDGLHYDCKVCRLDYDRHNADLRSEYNRRHYLKRKKENDLKIHAG